MEFEADQGQARPLTGAAAIRWWVDRSYTGGLEREEENPTVGVLDRLAKTLGVSISEFFKQPRLQA